MLGWPGVLLVQPLAELFAELLDGLALVSEYQEPEPFGLLGLLYKQFACVRRGHVHLPFLVARIAKIADSLRALEESEKRMTLEREKLELLRMRATGAVDVPDPETDGEDAEEMA